MVALVTIVGKQNQPRYPLTDEWTMKLWYSCTMTFYSAMKKNENKECAGKWMKLEIYI